MSSASIFVVVFGGIALLGVLAAIAPGILRGMQERRVAAEGLPAQAQVLSLAPTGTVINRVEEVRIRLRVTPASGEAPFEAEVVRTVGVADAVRLAPGQSVPVRYSAAPPHRVAILP